MHLIAPAGSESSSSSLAFRAASDCAILREQCHYIFKTYVIYMHVYVCMYVLMYVCMYVECVIAIMMRVMIIIIKPC